jgi:biofilm protein TabA
MALITPLVDLARFMHYPAAVAHYIARLLAASSPEQQRILAMTPGQGGRIPLADEAYASEQCYLTRAEEGARFESHRRFIDIQVLLQGREWIEWAPIDRLAVEQEYDAEADVMFFATPGLRSRLLLEPGLAAVFWPSDAHRPCLAVDDAVAVCKTVVKLPVTVVS